MALPRDEEEILRSVAILKESEPRPERSESLLQMAGRMTRMGGWAVDLPDLELTWSEGVCAIHDVPADFEPTVEQALNFYAPESVSMVRERLGACLSVGTPFDIEVEILTAAGRRVWIRSIGEAVRDRGGMIRRVEGALQDISDRKRIEQEVRRRSERLAAIVGIQHTLSTSEKSVEQLFDTIAQMAQRVLGADGAVFEMIDGEQLVHRAVSGIASGSLGFRHDIGAGLSRQAIRLNKPLRCDDTETDPRVDGPACRRMGFRSMTVAPLRSEGRPIGALKLVASQPDRFTETDTSSLELLAESFSAVIQRRLDAENLRASEAQYRLLFVGSPQPMWVLDPDSLEFLAANKAALKCYGYSEQEFLRMTIRDIQAFDYLPLFDQRARPLIRQKGTRMVHARHRTKQGGILEVDVTLDDIEFQSRSVVLVLGDDVTERMRVEREAARANRALKMLSACNEALIRAEDEPLLLQSACRLCVEIGGFPMVWVGYAMEDEKRIVPQAHAGNEDGYLGTLDLKWKGVEEGTLGPAGRAIDSGEPVVVSDVATETLVAWKDEARRRGFLGAVCLPLSDNVRTFGVLVLHVAEIRDLPAEELLLLQDLANDLAFGIVTLRARAEQRRTDSAVLAMARGVSASTGGEFFEKLLTSLVETLGAHAGFISQITGDQAIFNTLIAVAGGRAVAGFDFPAEGLLPEEPGTGDLWIVPRNVYRLYPQYPSLTAMRIESYAGVKLIDSNGHVVGRMGVLFQEELAQQEFGTSTIRIFASRAAAELERQKADAQVRRQAALIDEAPSAIFVQDLEGKIVFWNKGAERLYGWPGEYAVGLPAGDLFRMAPGEAEASELVVRKTGAWGGELLKSTSSGAAVTVDSRVTLLRDSNGQPHSVLVIDTDITERKKLEQQFLRAQRMDSIGTLASGIAHDLNNMLMPIIMGASLLKRVDPDEGRLRTIENIERSARRGAELVKQVLSFARGVEGARVPVSVEQVMNEVLAMVESTFPRNVLVETEVAEDIRPIIGDPTQINQVLLNFCVNARDAMPDGGRLAMAARNIDVDEKFALSQGEIAAGPYVLLEVSDNGTGMTKEIVERIFEPFFTTKELNRSTGLGLSTTFGIVRSHGGFLDVYSEPGHGSVFKAFFPAQVDVAAEPCSGAAPVTLQRGNGELILVVDDEVSILSLTRQTLEDFGYRVVTAEDGEQAISVFTKRHSEIALVLTDTMMPIMGGPALIAALEGIDPQVRIVAGSGLNSDSRLKDASSSAVRHFLLKPYGTEVMLNTIHRILTT